MAFITFIEFSDSCTNHGWSGCWKWTCRCRFDTPSFKLEHDLQTYAEDQIFSIQEGVHPDVLALAMKGECATNGVQIKGLEVQKYFPIDVVRKFSMSRYKGHYIVELFQCKRPERIKKPVYSRFN